jgi:2-hydroxy-3-keto-5-methylthiopentenyl-1-phosphate phosphatase
MSYYVVLCDFDGTITTSDSTDALFERFCPASWRDLDLAWQRGELSTAAQITRCYEMITATHAEIDHFLDGIALDPHFPAFSRACATRGWPVVILSDGLDYHIQRILAGCGLDGLALVANHMAFEAGVPRFAFQRMCPYQCPQGDRSEGVCKRLAVERARQAVGRTAHGAQAAADSPTVVFVGDGASDRCAVAYADIVFAKGALAAHCEARGIPYRRFATFAEVAAALFEQRI